MIPISVADSTPECVFIIDSDPEVRDAMRRLLHAAGRNGEIFSCPSEFMDRLPRDGPGCVVLDLQILEASGADLWEIMSGNGGALPVIFLTGHGDVHKSVEAMKKGAMDVLVKPVDEEVLLRTVDEALSRHAAEHARQSQLRDVMNRLSRLSPREHEVLEHLIRGRRNKQIAADLDIAVRTVKAHRGSMMVKMECGSVAALILTCVFVGVGQRFSARAGCQDRKIDNKGHYRILAPIFKSPEAVNHSGDEYVRYDATPSSLARNAGRGGWIGQ